MSPTFEATFWGFVSGGALVLGAAGGYFARVPSRVIAGVMAFGSGVLISALSFELMEEAFRQAGLLAPPQPAGICQHSTQGLASISVTPQALVRVMDEWADQGIKPPKSNYPLKKDLVTLAEYQAAFPTIPGMEPPSVLNELHVMDFGPLFDSEGGIQTLLPPLLGAPYTVLVPRPGRNGDGEAGIETMFTRAPLGTNVGWNVQAGFRAPDLCSLSGSFLPFAETKGERLANGDSRESLEERYKDHRRFVKAVEKAARQLVKERFLLEEDAAAFIQAAEESDVLR